MTQLQRVTVDAIIRTAQSFHPDEADNYFDPGARRFFGERLPHFGFVTPNRVTYGWVTYNTDHRSMRGYTVRTYDIRHGFGSGQLCRHPTRQRATTALRRVLLQLGAADENARLPTLRGWDWSAERDDAIRTAEAGGAS